jgi:hypothetical protein
MRTRSGRPSLVRSLLRAVEDDGARVRESRTCPHPWLNDDGIAGSTAATVRKSDRDLPSLLIAWTANAAKLGSSLVEERRNRCRRRRIRLRQFS